MTENKKMSLDFTFSFGVIESSVFWIALGHTPPQTPKKKINTYFFYSFQFFTHHEK